MAESKEIKIAVSVEEKKRLKAKAGAEGTTMQAVFYPLIQNWLAGGTQNTDAPDSSAKHRQSDPLASELRALSIILSGRDASAKRAIRALLQEFAGEQRTDTTDITTALRDAERLAHEARRAAEAGGATGAEDNPSPPARRTDRARKA